MVAATVLLNGYVTFGTLGTEIGNSITSTAFCSVNWDRLEVDALILASR